MVHFCLHFFSIACDNIYMTTLLSSRGSFCLCVWRFDKLEGTVWCSFRTGLNVNAQLNMFKCVISVSVSDEF